MIFCPMSRVLGIWHGRTGHFCSESSAIWWVRPVSGRSSISGPGIPAADNVHEVAHQAAAEVRVAYVDNGPIVHVHANALLTGEGNTSIVLADLRDPAGIVAHLKVQELIDFTEPVALLLVAIVHFLPDEQELGRSSRRCGMRCRRDSYLSCHTARGTSTTTSQLTGPGRYIRVTAPLVLSSHAQVSGFFNVFDLVDPGIAQCRCGGRMASRLGLGSGEDRHLRRRRQPLACSLVLLAARQYDHGRAAQRRERSNQPGVQPRARRSELSNLRSATGQTV